MRRGVWLAAWLVALAVGASAAVVARADPGYAFADSSATVVVELAVGYTLIACGLLSWRRRPGRPFGVLLAAAGLAWFVLEWNNPGVGLPWLFTVGLVLSAAAGPLVAHAVLSYSGAPVRALERAVIAVAYAGSLLLLGVLPALVFDPAAQGCSQCPSNLLLLSGNAGLYRDLNRAGLLVGLFWTSAVLALCAWRISRSSAPVRRAVAPVAIAGCVYLVQVGADFALSVGRGYLSNDPVDQRLWLAEAGALWLLVLAIAWSWFRERRTRAGLAQLVVELARAPAPGGLERALASLLRDPELRLAYTLGDGRYVDANGHPSVPQQTSTRLVRDGAEVALLAHRPGLLDDPVTADTLAATTTLTLEHERLRAELLARLSDLRSSRARIIAVGDAERRRLERDLHDGAQQLLVAGAIEARVARSRIEANAKPDERLLRCLQQAEAGLSTALDELRHLAQGICPAALVDEGLAAAVDELADHWPGCLRIAALPERRFDPAAETAAYRLIVQTLRDANGEPVSLAVSVVDRLLVIELESTCAPGTLTELEDRVGSLDGRLGLVDLPGGGARIRAEIPCAS